MLVVRVAAQVVVPLVRVVEQVRVQAREQGPAICVLSPGVPPVAMAGRALTAWSWHPWWRGWPPLWSGAAAT